MSGNKKQFKDRIFGSWWGSFFIGGAAVMSAFLQEVTWKMKVP